VDKGQLLVTQAEQKNIRLAEVARTGSGRVVGHSDSVLATSWSFSSDSRTILLESPE